MDPNYATGIAMLYRDHMISTAGYKINNCETRADFIELAKAIPVPAFEAERGWRSDPPFPGFTEEPEDMKGRWRMICATRIYEGEREIGTLFMTLLSGRTTTVVMNAPGTIIPQEYLPLASR